MAHGLSLPQAGILCVVALGIGVVMGTSLAGGSLPGQGSDLLTVTADETRATVTGDGLDAGVVVLTYGQDNTYGMVGSARVNGEGGLRMTLPGLETGTSYRYRATLVRGNGSMTRIGTGSFTTAPATGGQPGGSADNVTATTDPEDAGNVFDGDNSTGWGPSDDESGSGGDEVEAYLDFGYDQSQDIVGFGVLAQGRDGSGSMEFLLLVDGEEFGPYTVQSGDAMQYYTLETVGQQFRIGVLDVTNGTTVREFELRTSEELE